MWCRAVWWPGINVSQKPASFILRDGDSCGEFIHIASTGVPNYTASHTARSSSWSLSHIVWPPSGTFRIMCYKCNKSLLHRLPDTAGNDDASTQITLLRAYLRRCRKAPPILCLINTLSRNSITKQNTCYVHLVVNYNKIWRWIIRESTQFSLGTLRPVGTPHVRNNEHKSDSQDTNSKQKGLYTGKQQFRNKFETYPSRSHWTARMVKQNKNKQKKSRYPRVHNKGIGDWR